MTEDQNQIDDFFAKPDKTSVNQRIAWLPTRAQLRHLPKILSKKERYIILVLALIALGALIAMPIVYRHNTTVPAPAHGGSFSEGVIGPIRRINPVLAQQNTTENDATRLVFAGLMRYDETGTLQPDLAKSIELDDDRVSYIVTLRDNALWHDGTPVTSDDVAFTIRTIQNPDYQSPHRAIWQSVTVTVLDNKTVSLRLRTPYAQFPNNFTQGIMPKHVWETVDPETFPIALENQEAIGAGPYRILDVDRNADDSVKQIYLGAHEDYHHGRPFINNITINVFNEYADAVRAYYNGGIDNVHFIAPEHLPTNTDSPEIHQIGQPRYFGVFFNHTHNDILANESVRQALQHGTNKQIIVDQTLQGYGDVIESPLMPNITGVAQPQGHYGFDSNKALSLLEESGVASPSVTITTVNALELPLVAQELQKQWNAIGITTTIEAAPIAEIRTIIEQRDYDVLLFGQLLAPNPDPFEYWHSSRAEAPGANVALYNDASVDELLFDAQTEFDEQKRLEAYAQVQNRIIEDSPAIFLYTLHYIYGQDTKIKTPDLEVIALPAHRFDTIDSWYIKTKRVKNNELDNDA